MATQRSEPLSTLPPQLTSFVGREDEIARARDLLGAARLLTLTGPGGSGKTRLALAVAENIQDGFSDGVVFVSLAPIIDPELVPSAIASALGFALSSERPPIEQLVDTLSDRDMLLILDNFEQVASAAPLVAALLAGCAQLTVIVTSRVPLRLSAEQVFPVPPLALPDEQGRLALGEVEQNAAVTLFVMRARALDPSFRVTESNARGVVDVCWRLDGLPLAIELAAARIGVFTPRELADRIQQRLPALARGPLDAPLRQQTIHDAIAWSYDLLSEEQRGLFAWLSVFSGGWTIDAAEAIAYDTSIDVLETLAALIDHSLVQQSVQPDGSTRYGMLETIREFGRARLAENGHAAGTSARHAAYFTELATRAETAYATDGRAAWLQRLEIEIHNLRVALTWSTEHNPETSLRLAGALGVFWLANAHLREGGDWLESALARGASAPLPIRAKSILVAGQLACWQGEYEQAAWWLDAALEMCQTIGDAGNIGYALFALARTAHFSGDFDRAHALYEQSKQWFEQVGNWDAIAGGIGNRGNMFSQQGDLERAQHQIKDALRLCREHGLFQMAIWAQTLGEFLLRHDNDRSRVRPLLIEALLIDVEFYRLRIPVDVEAFALLAIAEGQPERAARLHGAAHRLRKLTGFPVIGYERHDYEGDIAAIRAALSWEAFDSAWAAGEAMTVEEAIVEALQEPEATQLAATSTLMGLTTREMDVLRLIVEGLSDKEVAAQLSISPYTVMRHVQNILGKLGVPSRTAAATFAVRNGLV